VIIHKNNMSVKTLKICSLDEILPCTNTGKFKRILIIKPSSLGDILQALPAFYLLRKSLPEAQIDWLVNSNLSDVFSYIKNDLGRIIYFRRDKFRMFSSIPGELINLINVLRKNTYDLVIDMQGLIRSALMAFITKSKYKVGFSDAKEKISGFFYDNKISAPKEIVHAIEKNCYLISSVLGIENRVPNFVLPKPLGFKMSHQLKSLGLESNDEYITVSPVARWKTKTWPPDFFGEIIDSVALAFPWKKIIILGSWNESSAISKVISSCKIAKPINLCGKTNIEELFELIRNSQIFIGNDSGSMHVASLLRVPVFTFFGSTDPEKTGPYWPCSNVYQAKIDCIKCLKRICPEKNFQCHYKLKTEPIIKDIITKLKKLT